MQIYANGLLPILFLQTEAARVWCVCVCVYVLEVRGGGVGQDPIWNQK